MHDTIVKTKDGREVIGILRKFKPQDGYFELGDIRFDFNEVASVITKEDRLPDGKIGDVDEIQRARDYLICGRKYGWFPKEIPVQNWEKSS